MDVAVRLPFRIDLDILGVEDRFPSIQFAVAVEDHRSSSTLSFHDEIWIEHAKWSVFVNMLLSATFASIWAERREIAFADIDEALRCELRGQSDGVALRVSYRAKKRSGKVSFEIVEEIDDDTFGHIQRAFAECPIR